MYIKLLSRYLLHIFNEAKVLTQALMALSAHTRAYLCGRSNTTSLQPHPLQTFLAFPPALRYSPHNHTSVVCLINCHRPTSTSCHAHQGICRGQRSHRTGTRSPITRPGYGPAMPRPTGSNETCIQARVHTQDLGHAHKLN